MYWMEHVVLVLPDGVILGEKKNLSVFQDCTVSFLIMASRAALKSFSGLSQGETPQVKVIWVPRAIWVLTGIQEVVFIVQFSRSVLSDSLWPHEPQHARPPCPSPTPGAHPNPCPLSRWCHPTISSSVVPSSPASIFPSIRAFSNEPALCIRWPKYWSFSFNISPSNGHPRLTDLL